MFNNACQKFLRYYSDSMLWFMYEQNSHIIKIYTCYVKYYVMILKYK